MRKPNQGRAIRRGLMLLTLLTLPLHLTWAKYAWEQEVGTWTLTLAPAPTPALLDDESALPPGTTDTGTSDTGTSDTGSTDTGTSDTGLTDTGSPDA